VELDCVSCDSGLSVVEVEESDAGDGCLGAEPDGGSRATHLSPCCECGSTCAGDVWCLGDHRAPSVAKDEVEVEVGLRADEGNGCGDAKHVALEREPGQRQGGWSRASD
jgi:hypothetical protein